MNFSRELIVPASICAVTFSVALALVVTVGMTGRNILFDYFAIAGFATLLPFLIWCLLPFIRPVEFRRHSPIAAGMALLRQRALLFILPLFISPVFMTGFTLSKSAFPYLVGFQWDGFWTVSDTALFGGHDAWQLTHHWIGPDGTLLLGQCYTIVWGLIAAFVPPFLLMSSKPEVGLRFYTARMLLWFLGGVVGATLFSSVGPIFADLVDPALGMRFEPLRASLATLLPEGHVILQSQDYLRGAFGIPEAIRAGGISAMPSMHLGVAAMFAIVSWRTVWFFPMAVFWVMIWIASVHFGYHYALDGIFGALIAWICWKMAAPKRRNASVSTPTERLAIA
jgi:hypothetical protein